MMICKSMKSKGYLKEVFAWQYQYFTLTLDGIRALCDHLGLSSNVSPDIYKQTGSRRQNMERGLVVTSDEDLEQPPNKRPANNYLKIVNSPFEQSGEELLQDPARLIAL